LDNNADGFPDAWGTWVNFTRSNTAVHNGNFSGRFQSTANDGAGIKQSVAGLTAGATYHLSGFVNIPSTTDAFTFQLQVIWKDSTGATISTAIVKTYTAATTGWDQASAALVAPTGTVKADVRMVVSNLNATIYVDDVTMAP
jgi:hypothetical protein